MTTAAATAKTTASTTAATAKTTATRIELLAYTGCCSIFFFCRKFRASSMLWFTLKDHLQDFDILYIVHVDSI
jgi:hypothetical protein